MKAPEAGLAAKLKLANGESLEESDPGDREEASPVRQKNAQDSCHQTPDRADMLFLLLQEPAGINAPLASIKTKWVL